MGIWAFIKGVAKSKGNICPYCHKPLSLADESLPDGLIEEEMWQTVYQTFFIPLRRQRWICTNPSCKHNFKKTHSKFVRTLLNENQFALEHMLSDTLDPPPQKSKKSSPNVSVPEQKAAVVAEEENDEEEEDDQEEEETGGGRYKGTNPLAGVSARANDYDDE